jgi:hypothetical protein
MCCTLCRQILVNVQSLLWVSVFKVCVSRYFVFNFWPCSAIISLLVSSFSTPSDCQMNIFVFRIHLPILRKYYSCNNFILRLFFFDSSKQTCVNSKHSFAFFVHFTASVYQHLLLKFLFLNSFTLILLGSLTVFKHFILYFS